MNPVPPDHQELKRIGRDVRWLTYRAGKPHPLTKSIFMIMLLPLLLIVVFGFVIELGIQLHLIQPVPKPAPTRPTYGEFR
jgi:hypothetical protein